MHFTLVIIRYLAFGTNRVFSCDAPKVIQSIQNGGSTESVLELIFRECNHVDRTEWVTNKSLRSMSVGDEVIIFNGEQMRRFSCEVIGWKEILSTEETSVRIA